MSVALRVLFAHSAETDGMVVRVAVSFLADQSQPAQSHWFWAYHIRIENERDDAVQLLTRRWIITDGRGARHQVAGDGVVGDQPLILPGASYDYVSGCPLDTASGTMEGVYGMVDADGAPFEIRIPRFPLAAPAAAE